MTKLTVDDARELRARGLLNLDEVVQRLQAAGVDLGRGDPKRLIRYLQTVGAIDPPVVALDVRPPHSRMAYYPPSVVNQVMRMRRRIEFKYDMATYERFLLTYFRALPPEEQLGVDAEAMLRRKHASQSMLDIVVEALSSKAPDVFPAPKAQRRANREKMLSTIRRHPELLRMLSDDHHQHLRRLAKEPVTDQERVQVLIDRRIPLEAIITSQTTAMLSDDERRMAEEGWTSPVAFAAHLLLAHAPAMREVLAKGDEELVLRWLTAVAEFMPSLQALLERTFRQAQPQRPKEETPR